MQKTRLENLIRSLTDNVYRDLFGNWRNISISILSLLLGYYLGSNITAYFISSSNQRTLIAIAMTLIIEIFIRFRSIARFKSWSKIFLTCENLRIGAVYAVVLEAFKLGS